MVCQGRHVYTVTTAETGWSKVDPPTDEGTTVCQAPRGNYM